MRRLLKYLAITLVTLVVLVIVALFALTQFINPNEFKPQIEQAALKNANITLDIQGDLGWTFWPSLGVSIGKTAARIGESDQQFADIQQVNASVAVWPLLFGQVHVDGIHIDGLKLHLIQTKEGGNWAKIGAPADASTTPTKTATNQAKTTTNKQPAAANNQQPLDIPVVIPEVSITHADIIYDDKTSGTHITVSDINLKATDVNLKDATPFPLSLSLRYQDNANRVDLNLDTKVSLDIAGQHYRLAPMTLKATIAGPLPKPVSVKLEQSLDANLADGVVAIKDLVLKAAGVTTKGRFTLSGLNADKMTFAGALHVAPFDANAVMSRLGLAPIETSDADALSHVALDATIKGPAGSIMVNPLVVTLDDSTLKGKAGLASIATSKIVFDLALDGITLDGYLPPKSTAKTPTKASSKAEGNAVAKGGDNNASQKATKPLSTAPLLPLDTLRGLNIDGHVSVGELHYVNINGKQFDISVNANHGKLDASTSGQLMQGSFDVSAKLNASNATPKMSAQGKISQMQIQPAAILALGKDLVKGTLSATFSGSAQGNSEKSLMTSASGDLTLHLVDGTIRGANLHDALAAGVNNMLGKYSGLLALLPKAKKLPRGLSEDTKIVDLVAKGHFADQVAHIKQIKAQLKKGNLNGHGWLNINNSDFDFRLGLQSPEFSDSPYFKNTNWPIRCAGNLNGDAGDWCGPDRDGLEDIAKQALAKAAKRKLAEKLGIDAKGDTAKEMVENAAKQKVEEAKQKAKEKAKEKLQDELKEGLNSLFH